MPASALEPFVAEAVKNISKELDIPGFRPGKAPKDIVEEKVGKLEVLQEAAKLALPKMYVKAVTEEKVNVIGEPRVEIKKLAPGNVMVFTAEAAVLPQITLPDYKNMKLKPRKVKVEPKEKEDTMKNLQKSRTTYKTVERGAEKGDLVEMGFKSYLNKVPVEDGEAKDQRLVIGQDYLLPAPKFDEKLLGMKAKEDREFIIKMPDDFHQKNLAGRDLEFKIRVKLVQAPEVPELNDNFARSLGKYKTLEELEKQIEDNLLKQAEMKEKGRFEMELMDKISDKTEINIPDLLIDSETDKMIHELKHNLEAQGGNLDDYLKSLKKSMDDFKKELRDRAIKRVKIGLILREIAEKEKVKVDDAEIQKEIDATKKKYQGTDDKIKKQIESLEYKDYVKGLMKNRKVFELLSKSVQD